MGSESRRFWRSALVIVLIASFGWAGAAETFAAQAGEEDGQKASPRSMAGPETGRPADPAEGGKSKTWLTVAIVAGIAAVVLVAVLLLKKKKSPSATTTTAPATTTVSTTTTTVLSDTGSIQVGSNPAGAKLFLDGTDTGKTTPSLLSGVAAGSHAVKLTLVRYQDWQTAVSVAKDQTASVNAALQAGDFTEDFNGGNAPFWQPTRGNWAVGGGAYATNAAPSVNFAASQYTLGDFGDFTLEVRGQVLRPNGGSGRAYGVLFRGTTDLNKYYIFHVNPGGASPLWDVFEIANDAVVRQYDPWQPTTLIKEGWNTVKIVARGSSFTFYVNGQLLGSRTIPEAPARGRVGLSYEVDLNGSDLQFDDVVLSGSAPSSPFGGVMARAPRFH
jgi:hypothetical protein